MTYCWHPLTTNCPVPRSYQVIGTYVHYMFSRPEVIGIAEPSSWLSYQIFVPVKRENTIVILFFFFVLKVRMAMLGI